MAYIEEKQNAMNTFISELSARRMAAEATENIKHSRTYRWGVLKDKKAEGIKNAAQEVFLTIYHDALPLDKEYKDVYANSLNSRVLDFAKRQSGTDDIYAWLKTQAGCKKSIPAKKICAAVESKIDEACSSYYEDDESDVESIDVSPSSTIVQNAVDQITKDMDMDQVSAIIENNVRATITKEIETSKEEDEKLAALEEQLAADDSVVGEEGIEVALLDAGFKPNTMYKPSLFNGIMIGQVKSMEAKGLSGQDVQKQAFYESVQELTALQTAQTLCLIDINVNNMDKVAMSYTSN